MKEFAAAALPWVLAGIAVAVICASFAKINGKRKKEDQEKQEEQKKNEKLLEKRMAAGLLAGLLLGVLAHSTGLIEDQGTAYALGSLWGMAIAAIIGEPKN